MDESAIPNKVTPTIVEQLEGHLADKSTDQPQKPLQIVLDFVRVLVGQSTQPLDSILHPSVELEIYGPPGMIWQGRAKGFGDVLARLRENFAAAEDQQTEILHAYTSPRTAMLVLREKGKLKGGPTYAIHGVQVWTIEGDQIIGIHEMLDDPSQLRLDAPA